MPLIDATCRACQHTFRIPSTRKPADTKCPRCGALQGEEVHDEEVQGEPAVAPEPPPEPAPSRAGARAGRPAGARSEARPRAGATPARAGRAKPAAKKSRLPLVLVGVGTLVVIVVLGFVMAGQDDAPAQAQAAEAPKPLDLATLLPDLPPLEGTPENDWAAMNELMARYTKPPFGPNNQQAADRLMMKGKHSVPAILNGFKRLDLTMQDGTDIGWKIQTLTLSGLCNGADFGWLRSTRPEDVVANQKVIQRWFEAWKLAEDDEAMWAEIAKAKGIPPGMTKGAKPAPAAEEPPAAEDTGG